VTSQPTGTNRLGAHEKKGLLSDLGLTWFRRGLATLNKINEKGRREGEENLDRVASLGGRGGGGKRTQLQPHREGKGSGVDYGLPANGWNKEGMHNPRIRRKVTLTKKEIS